MTTTPNMLIPLSTPSVTTGPAWATGLNNAITTIDAHDHTSGKGKALTNNSFSVVANFDVKTYRITNTGAVQLNSQTSSPSGATDANGFFVVNGDFWFVNSAGTAIQITSGSSINVSSVGGISGMGSTTASCTYSDITKCFTFLRSSTVAADIQTSGVFISYPSAGTSSVKIAAPVAASAWTMTLPQNVPGSTSWVLSDTSGNLSFSTSLAVGTITTLTTTTAGITTANIGTANVTTGTITTGTVTTLSSTTGTITTLGSTTGNITTVNSTTVNATTGNFTGATIPTLGSTTATITTANITTANITNLNISSATIPTLGSTTGTITTVNSTTGNITTVNSTTVNATTANAATFHCTGNLSIKYGANLNIITSDSFGQLTTGLTGTINISNGFTSFNGSGTSGDSTGQHPYLAKKLLTGTFSSGNLSITHGISSGATRILSIAGFITSSGTWIVIPITTSTSNGVSLNISDTAISGITAVSAFQSSNIRLLVTYTD